MTWRIALTPLAKKRILDIKDHRIRKKIGERIDGLRNSPDKQGKPLLGPLFGYRSLRAVGQRYRIIYRIEKDKVVVLIVAIGIRKENDKHDIYTLAKKLMKLGLLNL